MIELFSVYGFPKNALNALDENLNGFSNELSNALNGFVNCS